MAKENLFKVSTYLNELSRAEKEFLKDTIKNGEECGCFGSVVRNPEGKLGNGSFLVMFQQVKT